MELLQWTGKNVDEVLAFGGDGVAMSPAGHLLARRRMSFMVVGLGDWLTRDESGRVGYVTRMEYEYFMDQMRRLRRREWWARVKRMFR